LVIACNWKDLDAVIAFSKVRAEPVMFDVPVLVLGSESMETIYWKRAYQITHLAGDFFPILPLYVYIEIVTVFGIKSPLKV